jgi:uncharacterized membrane protein
MRTIRFWIPTIIGALVMPAVYYLIVFTAHGPESHAGAGLGLILLFYPVPAFVLTTFVSPSNNTLVWQISSAIAFGVAAFQFPLYGFIISYARLKQTLWLRILAGIIWFHIIVIVIVLTIALIRWLL